MTEKTIVLEEVVMRTNNLTIYLEIDSRLIPTKDNYRYSISGLAEDYEAGETVPSAFGRLLGSIFNPADMLTISMAKSPKNSKSEPENELKDY